mgnify:CR=1 FL=1
MMERGVKQKWSVAVSGRVIKRGLTLDQANMEVTRLVPMVPNIAMFQEATDLGGIA